MLPTLRISSTHTALSVCIGLLLIVGVGEFVLVQNKDTMIATREQESSDMQTVEGATSTPSTRSSVAQSPAPTQKPSGVSLTEVATHNSRTSCWSVINGNVYDLTSWIPKHPGGEGAILKLCGTDGSKKYNDEHGGAQKQATILSGFKIGTATQ